MPGPIDFNSLIEQFRSEPSASKKFQIPEKYKQVIQLISPEQAVEQLKLNTNRKFIFIVCNNELVRIWLSEEGKPKAYGYEFHQDNDSFQLSDKNKKIFNLDDVIFFEDKGYIFETLLGQGGTAHVKAFQKIIDENGDVKEKTHSKAGKIYQTKNFGDHFEDEIKDKIKEQDLINRLYREKRKSELPVNEREFKFHVNEQYAVVIMPDGKVNLWQYLKDNSNLAFIERLKLVRAAIAEVMKLHELEYAHGDIKLANFVYDGNKLRLIDLDGAKTATNKENTYSPFTFLYASKKRFGDEQNYGPNTYEEDIYSLGAAIVELLGGKFRNFNLTGEKIYFILHSNMEYPTLLLSWPPTLSTQIISLIQEKHIKELNDLLGAQIDKLFSQSSRQVHGALESLLKEALGNSKIDPSRAENFLNNELSGLVENMKAQLLAAVRTREDIYKFFKKFFNQYKENEIISAISKTLISPSQPAFSQPAFAVFIKLIFGCDEEGTKNLLSLITEEEKKKFLSQIFNDLPGYVKPTFSFSRPLGENQNTLQNHLAAIFDEKSNSKPTLKSLYVFFDDWIQTLENSNEENVLAGSGEIKPQEHTTSYQASSKDSLPSTSSTTSKSNTSQFFKKPEAKKNQQRKKEKFPFYKTLSNAAYGTFFWHALTEPNPPAPVFIFNLLICLIATNPILLLLAVVVGGCGIATHKAVVSFTR